MVRTYLAERFLRFDEEYTIDVWRASAIRGDDTGAADDAWTETADEGEVWRILLRRRREAKGPVLSDPVANCLQDEWGRVLHRTLERLEHCTCGDGCAACCGGLEAPTPAQLDELDHDHWRAEDAVSRSGAYRLVCALLDREPNWAVYDASQVGDTSDGPPTDAELRIAVREVLGSREQLWHDGLWHSLFGAEMPLDELGEHVAPARWIEPGVIDAHVGVSAAGYYRGTIGQDGSAGDVFISTSLRDQPHLRAVILHEYVHNWQFKTPGRFAHDRLNRGPEVVRYFDGTLVVEGHARWCEHVYGLSKGEGPVHRVDDDSEWNQYKTGFFLVHRIEQTFGRRGLFLWLRFGSTYDASNPEHRAFGAAPQSRFPQLPHFPFTVAEALRAWGLEDEALTGEFFGVDFGEADLTQTQIRSETSE
jgi:hypothetical protein